MSNTSQLIVTSVTQSFHELRANKLRTFLSLLGITIGIFCIIAVLTVLDSMKDNVHKEMSKLGSDIIYVNRWPWMADDGEYKWWEFWRRPSMTLTELKAVQTQVPDVAYATLCLTDNNLTLKQQDQELSSITGDAVMPNFDKLQNINIATGRYLSTSELEAGTNVVVLGAEVYNGLFAGNINAIGKSISFLGRRFTVVGIMKKEGENMFGNDYDNTIIYPYYAAASLVDIHSLQYDPQIIIKAADGKNVSEVKYEIEGVLRRLRKVKPGQKDNFAINQLSQVIEKLDVMFDSIDIGGYLIGGFSLLIGAFGIANIMFVTVKERTKVIGLKKALGARSGSILMEFLIEAVTLCLIGGLIGIVIVLLLSLILTYGLDFAVTLSIKNFLLGMGISATVGILAGFIPARTASKLDPVVAIRSN